MTATLFWLAVGALLWLIGLHGLLTLRDALRRIITPSDPILVALVVTGLVVAVSATALALRLAGSIEGGRRS